MADVCRTIVHKQEGKFDYSALLVPLKTGKTSWSTDLAGLTAILDKIDAGEVSEEDVAAYLTGIPAIEEEEIAAAVKDALPPKKKVPARKKTATRTRKKPEPKPEPEPEGMTDNLQQAALDEVQEEAPKVVKPSDVVTAPVTVDLDAIKEAVKEVMPELPSTGQLIDIDSLTDTMEAMILRRLTKFAEEHNDAQVREDIDALRSEVDQLHAAVNSVGQMVVALNSNLLTYADIIVPGAEDHLAKIYFDVPDDPVEEAEPAPVPLEDDQEEEEELPEEPGEDEAPSEKKYTEAELKRLKEPELRALAEKMGLPDHASGYTAVLIHKLTRIFA